MLFELPNGAAAIEDAAGIVYNYLDLQSIDGNAGARRAHCAQRVLPHSPGERGPCIHSHRPPPRLAEAPASGGDQLEDHAQPIEEEPPVEGQGNQGGGVASSCRSQRTAYSQSSAPSPGGTPLLPGPGSQRSSSTARSCKSHAPSYLQSVH